MKRRTFLVATSLLSATGTACGLGCRAAGPLGLGRASGLVANGCTLTRVPPGAPSLDYLPIFEGASVGSSWSIALTSSALLFLNWLGFKDWELTSVAAYVGSYVAYTHKIDDTDIRIRVGWSWLQHCMEQDEATLDASNLGKPAIAAILAHEVAHLFQYKTGLYDRLTNRGQVVLKAELHADYMSGFMLGTVGRVRTMDMMKAAQMMSVAGDSNPLPIGHHGTPEQRRQALVAGWTSARHSRAGPQEASRSGLAAVERIAAPDAL